MVIDPTQEIVATSVISWPTSVVVKFSAIVKIHKYRRFHDGHHFISMTMEVHNAPWCYMDHFIEKCVHLFHGRWSKGHLSLFFCIQSFKQHVNNVLQRALAFVIKRKIALVGNVCSKLPITFRYHDLHVGNIIRAMGEIVFFHDKD
jgi:hypothetical protein